MFSACYVMPEEQLYQSLNTDDELHALFDGPEVAKLRRTDDSEVLVLTGGALPTEGNGWLPSGRLAIVPSVRDEFLTEPDAIAFPEPVRRIALGLSGQEWMATQVLDQMRTSSA